MSKTELRKEIDAKKREVLKDKINNSTPVLILRGIWMLAEGAALAITSGFALYQAYTQHYPVWGQYTLIVAGVLVLYPAMLLLSKLFRNAGRS